MDAAEGIYIGSHPILSVDCSEHIWHNLTSMDHSEHTHPISPNSIKLQLPFSPAVVSLRFPFLSYHNLS